MFENLRRDYTASRAQGRANLWRMLWNAVRNDGFRALCFYRVARWCRVRHFPAGAAVAERLMHHLCHCWISSLAEIGPGFRVAHVCGIVVPPNVIIGADCEIRQNVTLGGNLGKAAGGGRQTPVLGDRVSIGPGAVILGPIEVGAGTFVGANAVVTQSVPPNSIVAAFRAEVTAQMGADGTVVRDAKRVFLSRTEVYARIEALENRLAAIDVAKGDSGNQGPARGGVAVLADENKGTGHVD
jgi:serine O-acetyltransferase